MVQDSFHDWGQPPIRLKSIQTEAVNTVITISRVVKIEITLAMTRIVMTLAITKHMPTLSPNPFEE